MSITPETRPGRHSRRVAAWIYTIINPLIDALRSETWFLAKDNLSWRFHSRRAEHIRRIRDYIDVHYLPNFEDFIADNQEFIPKFDKHDAAVQNAEEKAAAFFDILISGQIFKNQVNQEIQQYESAGSSHPNIPSLDSMRNDLPKYVAENLINNVQDLPTHYTIHKFWELFGQSFRESLPEFEAYKDRSSFKALRHAVADLREAATELQHDLESYRLHLCREFDLPAAPPVPAGSSATEYFV